MPIISNLIIKSRIDPREAELLLAFVLHKDRPFVKAHKTDNVDSRVAQRFLKLCARRQKNEPIAYLTGHQPFFGRDFLVDRHVLIPRPETEVLADLVIRYLKRRTPRTLEDSRDVIVDVGTGSGCLAVTLALECPTATAIASDVSDATLKVAHQNARQLGARVKFVKDDLLGPKLRSCLTHPFPSLKLREGCRRRGELCFVANLPYLPTTDKKTMMPDVVKFEPSKALFAGQDGTSLIVKLMRQIKRWNLEIGIMNLDHKPHNVQNSLSHIQHSKFQIPFSIFLEIDPRQTDKLTALARQSFPRHKVKIEQDLCGRERFLTII